MRTVCRINKVWKEVKRRGGEVRVGQTGTGGNVGGSNNKGQILGVN